MAKLSVRRAWVSKAEKGFGLEVEQKRGELLPSVAGRQMGILPD